MLLVLLAAAPAGAGIEPLPPRTVIDSYPCGELATLDEESRDRALIYLSGVIDGRRGAKVLDVETLSIVVDRVMKICATTPRLAVIEAFRRARSGKSAAASGGGSP